jgi:hypothetical protein
MPNVVIDFAPPGSRGTGAAAFARVTRGTSVTGGGAEDVYGDTSTVRASEESSYAEAEAEASAEAEAELWWWTWTTPPPPPPPPNFEASTTFFEQNM